MKIEKLAKMYGRAVANQVNYYSSMYGYFDHDTMLAIQAAEFERISQKVAENCLEPREHFKLTIWGSGHLLESQTHYEFHQMTPPGQPLRTAPKRHLEERRLYCDTAKDTLVRSSYVFPEFNGDLGRIWHAIWDQGDNTHREPYTHWKKAGDR